VNDPYNADTPRGFVRAYYDLEPKLSDFANARAKDLRMSKRAYIRHLIINDQKEHDKNASSKIKKR